MMDYYNVVNFPGLGIYLKINPVAVNIFGFEIRWYAVIIAAGLVCAVLFALKHSETFDVSHDAVLDVAIWGAIAAIICARLYFVASDISYYSRNFWEIFNLRRGGIAIYGSIIGAVGSAYVYCRVKKVNIGGMFDVGALGLLIGQIIGRWANFINAEAYGGVTSLPWRMEVYDYAAGSIIAVHPTFLYESLWNLGLFIILYIYNKNKKFFGELFWLYIAGYGLGRSWIEQLRTDSLPYGAPYKISQIMAVASCIVAIAVIIIQRKRIKAREDNGLEQ